MINRIESYYSIGHLQFALGDGLPRNGLFLSFI